jgi:hypothetical protein
MKANLTFDLDDADDRVAHYRAFKSMDMAIALSEIAAELRRLYKYGGDEVHQETVEQIRSKFYSILEDNVLDLDALLR